MREFKKSNKLEHVCYDIRGPVLDEAKRLEEEGYHIYKLHIGNPAPFGLSAPDEIIHDVVINLSKAEGYTDSKGMFAARKAIMQYSQQKGIHGVTIEDIYTGNGVSELIVMCMQGLCNTGDEVLVPAPDYPLWTAAVNLAGGKAVHYMCDESAEWFPDLDDIKKKITPNTKAIVVINPNNPTGALYPTEILKGIIELARQHQVIIFADEIYDKILYDGNTHTSLASLADDVMFITLNGLSKAYRIAGFRGGWMVLSGKKQIASDFITGLNLLSSMRLCSNAPAQLAIQTALGGYQSINELIIPGGRLKEQRDCCYNALREMPGVSCVQAKGALYLFPRLDPKRFHIQDDQKFIFDLLQQEKILMVQGTGFNWPTPDHFRIVFLPPVDELKVVMKKLAHFLEHYKQ
jgi:alanine-synthesizing transaminase